MTNLKTQFVAAASKQNESLVVLLHGYGADGHDLIGLAQPLAGILPNTAFSSPHAPEPCSLNPIGRQWFCLPWIDGSSQAEMEAGFARATQVLQNFIEAEMIKTGIPANKCALVGFSQGTMMALHVGLRLKEKLGCIVGFSGKLILPEKLESEITSPAPIFLSHGDRDEVVPFASLSQAEAGLKRANVNVTSHVSKGSGHTIAMDSLQLAAQFLHKHLM